MFDERLSERRRRQLKPVLLVVGFLALGASAGVGLRALGEGVLSAKPLVLALGVVNLGGAYLVVRRTFALEFDEYYALGVALIVVTSVFLLAARELPETIFR